MLVNSDHVQRRVLITGIRFRSLINQDRSKSFDMRYGPRPVDLDNSSNLDVDAKLGHRERQNACSYYVNSLADSEFDYKLPSINIELRDIFEIGSY